MPEPCISTTVLGRVCFGQFKSEARMDSVLPCSRRPKCDGRQAWLHRTANVVVSRPGVKSLWRVGSRQYWAFASFKIFARESSMRPQYFLVCLVADAAQRPLMRPHEVFLKEQTPRSDGTGFEPEEARFVSLYSPLTSSGASGGAPQSRLQGTASDWPVCFGRCRFTLVERHRVVLEQFRASILDDDHFDYLLCIRIGLIPLSTTAVASSEHEVAFHHQVNKVNRKSFGLVTTA